MTPKAVCRRYGVSNRTLTRWTNDPATNFPRRIMVNSRVFYWDRFELDAWDQAKAAGRDHAGRN